MIKAEAAALSLLLIFTILAAHEHRISAVHAYCSEHGEVIHLDGGELLALGHVGQVELHGDRHLAGSHDCAVLDFLKHGALALELDHAVAVRPPGLAASVHRGRAGHPTIPLLLQSPKNSPPLS